jgi:hypothetical protein
MTNTTTTSRQIDHATPYFRTSLHKESSSTRQQQQPRGIIDNRHQIGSVKDGDVQDIVMKLNGQTVVDRRRRQFETNKQGKATRRMVV